MRIKNLIDEDFVNYKKPSLFIGCGECDFKCEKSCSSVKDYIDKHEQYSDFQTMLFKLIDDRNLKDSDVYNKVNIDFETSPSYNRNPAGALPLPEGPLNGRKEFLIPLTRRAFIHEDQA